MIVTVAFFVLCVCGFSFLSQFVCLIDSNILIQRSSGSSPMTVIVLMLTFVIKQKKKEKKIVKEKKRVKRDTYWAVRVPAENASEGIFSTLAAEKMREWRCTSDLDWRRDSYLGVSGFLECHLSLIGLSFTGMLATFYCLKVALVVIAFSASCRC